VFNIEKESVPGACAETITANGDVGKSSLVNVVTDFLNAGEDALSNQAAFAYIAVSGEGFCAGAWNGFLLNVKHMLSFTFANYIAKLFILLGKVAVCVVNGFTLVFIMKNMDGLAD
jgi:hypothetical protein